MQKNKRVREKEIPSEFCRGVRGGEGFIANVSILMLKRKRKRKDHKKICCRKGKTKRGITPENYKESSVKIPTTKFINVRDVEKKERKKDFSRGAR